ncbi:hypothetical protein SFRURICE_014729 [Spodoptera frugiperda]|nr:hypothetical protein SFRURICE_014729 [Spodoptera frugiperda]
MILTRKAHARQEESKLNLALSELKASRELCEQLMRGRDDNEREFLDVLNSNKKLKCEMAQLHTQHTEAIEARDRLQFVWTDSVSAAVSTNKHYMIKLT